MAEYYERRKRMEDKTKSLSSAYIEIGKALYNNPKVFDNLSAALQNQLASTSKEYHELNELILSVISNNLKDLISVSDDLLRSCAENLNSSLSSTIQDGMIIFDEIKNDDDYVIVDEKPIKEIDISETMTIPLGNNRVRMKTSDFINLLLIIVTALSLVKDFFNVSTNVQPVQQLIEVEQETNDILYNLLDSIDSSNSANPESVELLKEYTLNLHSEVLELTEAVQTLRSDISDLQDTVQDPDSTVLAEDSLSQVQSECHCNYPELTDTVIEPEHTESERQP